MLAQFIKEVGAPTALAFAIWHLANKALQIQQIVEALIRIDERLTNIEVMLVKGDGNDDS